MKSSCRLKTILIGLLSVSFSASAVRADVEGDRMNALAVEWYVANCGKEGLNGMTFALAVMILNGSDAAELEASRAKVRESITTQFPVRSDACAAMKAHYAADKSGASQ